MHTKELSLQILLHGIIVTHKDITPNSFISRQRFRRRKRLESLIYTGIVIVFAVLITTAFAIAAVVFVGVGVFLLPESLFGKDPINIFLRLTHAAVVLPPIIKSIKIRPLLLCEVPTNSTIKIPPLFRSLCSPDAVVDREIGESGVLEAKLIAELPERLVFHFYLLCYRRNKARFFMGFVCYSPIGLCLGGGFWGER